MPAFATVIAAFTCCCVVKDGRRARTRPGASIASWACNCATKRPKRRVKVKLRDDRKPATRSTRPGRWTSSMTSWQQDTSLAC